MTSRHYIRDETMRRDERFDSGDPFDLARGLVIAVVITVAGVSLGLAATEVISRLI